MSTQRLVLAGVAANAGVGSLFAWSLVSTDAARDLGLTSRAAAAVFAVAIVVMATFVLVTGRVLGQAGPRVLLVTAGAAAGGGLVLAASWQHPAGLWLGVAGLFGAANGVAYAVATALAARVPVRRRGAATGAVVAAYAGTPVVLGLVGPTLVAEHGWRACTGGLGLAVAGLLLLAAGLAPAGSPVGGESPAAPVAAAEGRTVPWLWLLFAGATAPPLLVFAHAVPLATMRGLDAAGAGATVTVLAAGNVAGRLLAGWVSDVVGRWPSLAAAVAAQVPALAALAWGAPAAHVAGYGLLGLCYGAASALVPAATADLVGAAAFPRSYARVFTAWGTAGLAAPLAGAGLLSVSAGRPSALLLAGLPLAPAAVAVWVLSKGRGPARSAGEPHAGEVGGRQDHL